MEPDLYMIQVAQIQKIKIYIVQFVILFYSIIYNVNIVGNHIVKIISMMFIYVIHIIPNSNNMENVN